VQENNTAETTPGVGAGTAVVSAVVSLETWPQPRSSAKAAAGIVRVADLKAAVIEETPHLLLDAAAAQVEGSDRTTSRQQGFTTSST
jgi:hypothetical protein